MHSIPYTILNGQKIVSAFVNGIKSTFIFDLNQDQTLINSVYFKDNKRISLDGKLILLDKLNLYGLKVINKNYKAQDLSLYEKNGRTIHGIFGQDIIEDYTLTIFDNRFILKNKI